LGVHVLALDLSIPFTAARARNEGFARLHQLQPGLNMVQFVDGDCEIDPQWLPTAHAFLQRHAQVAVVCGRRRERFAQQSVYNQLCDLEWDTPVGQAKACGGDALMRAQAFASVGGFRTGLIAGEEPELCVRLRAAGWKVWRLDAEMTLHDAAMTRFSQWWRRSMRAGYAYAEGAWLHGAAPERHWVRESRGLALLLLYPLQILRLARRGALAPRQRRLQALFLVLGKFPEAVGQLKFWRQRLLPGKSALIEYK